MPRRLLKFTLESPDVLDLIDRFRVNGRMTVNSLEWRGKPPRSCSVVGARTRERRREEGTYVWDVDVEYRSDDTIVYVGNTRYRGWCAHVPLRNANGEYITLQGNVADDGVVHYRAANVFEDMDYNLVDFGVFVAEVDIDPIPVVSLRDAMKDNTSFQMSIESQFTSPRRSRPVFKLLVVPGQIGPPVNSGYSICRMINSHSPQLATRVQDEINGALEGFLEGRHSLHTIQFDNRCFVNLDRVVIEYGDDNEPNFQCVRKFVTTDNMREIATRIGALYRVKCELVDDGKNFGIIFTPDTSNVK